MTWRQDYDPFGSWPLATLLASLPVVVLLSLLASGKVAAWRAALGGWLSAVAVSTLGFGMPASLALQATGYGLVFAGFKVVWLVVAAVFLYDIAVETGQFEVMKASIAQLSGDRRLQAVLIAFAFGAFIEGAAGFGAPVAISAAFLVGLGFRPFQAALLCLIANTAPVAWGSIGVPIKTLAGVTGLDVELLSQTSGRILPPISLIIPFWLVATLSGWRATWAVAPALGVIGGTFALVQWAWSNFIGVDLVDLVSAIASLLAGVAFLKVWRPSSEWRFPDDVASDPTSAEKSPLTPRRVARAWLPFALLTVTVLVSGLPGNKATGRPSVREWLDRQASWKPVMTELEGIAKGLAVTGHESPVKGKDFEKAVVDVIPLSATGTAVFLAAVVAGFWLGVGPVKQLRVLGAVVFRLAPALAAIFAMLALGFTTKYSGMDAVLGLALTRTGPWLYPFFGTWLGWLGVALTGSDTSSNVLFGNLQRITALKLGLNPILMASANTTGGVMGKMIDAQSIVVASAATGQKGMEGRLLRAVVGHSLALATLVGLIVWLYAHVVPGWVPTGAY